MTPEIIELSHPLWQPASRPAKKICVHLWRPTEDLAQLVVYAPNWANALVWGEAAAIEGWLALRHKLQDLNPSDDLGEERGLKLWLVRPGFPKDSSQLWVEHQGFYENIAREQDWVYPLTPVPGTALVKFGRVRGLPEMLTHWRTAHVRAITAD